MQSLKTQNKTIFISLIVIRILILEAILLSIEHSICRQFQNKSSINNIQPSFFRFSAFSPASERLLSPGLPAPVPSASLRASPGQLDQARFQGEADRVEGPSRLRTHSAKHRSGKVNLFAVYYLFICLFAYIALFFT